MTILIEPIATKNDKWFMQHYRYAAKVRIKAENLDDFEIYLRAAAEFRALGMTAAADRCDERARHYESPPPLR